MSTLDILLLLTGMSNSLSYILLLTGTASVIAALPQLIKLMRIKTAKEFSLFSWVIWLIYQSISVVYSLYIHAYAYVVINALWTIFYLCMVTLIFKYQQNSRS
jgi:uncharacterized protein with PQ loop repeat